MVIIKSKKVILFIEPKNKKRDEPLIDSITIKMFNLLNENINNTGVIDFKGNFGWVNERAKHRYF